jgi:queuine tRNA-ribosyltransferase
MNFKNARFAEDTEPLDESLDCPASREYSRAYIHHLIRAGEYLGSMLLSWHNIAYYQDLTRRMRAAIAAGEFEAFRKGFHARMDEGLAGSGPSD